MKLKNETTQEFGEKPAVSEKIYKLKEEERDLDMRISNEEFKRSSLTNNRKVFNFSIIKEVMVFLYFVVFLILFKGMLYINIKMWLIAKENPTIDKLIELMEGASGLIGTAVVIIIVAVGCRMIYKLFLIWLNSDGEKARLLARKLGKETYSGKIEHSELKLSEYYLRKKQIAEELIQLEQKQ